MKFLECIRPKLTEQFCDPDYILNMDQTPVPFTFQSTNTLEFRGTKAINIRGGSHAKGEKISMNVTKSCKVLKPLLVCKGKPGDNLKKKNFLLKQMACLRQEKLWMNEEVMLKWVDKVLKPYVTDSMEGIIPMYRCHIMDSVVGSVGELGVDVIHILGGCTGFIQPVDVGINKLFKPQILQQWYSWILWEGAIHVVTMPQMCENIANWSIKSLE